MKIKVVIEDTAPLAPEGTYVWVSGDTEDMSTGYMLDLLNSFILKSFNEMHVLKVVR